MEQKTDKTAAEKVQMPPETVEKATKRSKKATDTAEKAPEASKDAEKAPKATRSKKATDAAEKAPEAAEDAEKAPKAKRSKKAADATEKAPEASKDAEKAEVVPQASKTEPAPEKATEKAETIIDQPEKTAESEKTTEKAGAKQASRAAEDAGVIEPEDRAKEAARSDKFDMPVSYADRFVVTKGKDQQELFRSYEDRQPAIIDKGDQLTTKNADRATAMDMIELAAHRGWQSLRAKGPEEFRREMWIEGTAHGLKVDGYRPSDKDVEEAKRRSELVQARVIERTDEPEKQRDLGAKSDATSADSRSNVVKLPVVDYAAGVSGRIEDIGSAPYRNREGGEPVPFVKLAADNGKTETIWSVTLPDAVEKNDLKVGDRATFFSPGTEAVVYTATDRETGKEVQRNGQRRIWEARDVEKAIEAPQKKDEPIIEKIERPAHPTSQKQDAASVTNKDRQQDTATDRLEDRIKKFEPGDTQVRGAASALSRLDVELRAAGISEKEREAARNEVAKVLAQGISKGQTYPVQKLPNVTQEQVHKAQEAARQTVQPKKTQERATENSERSPRER